MRPPLGEENPTLKGQCRNQSTAGAFLPAQRPVSFAWYEVSPDSKGILFENGMRFHGAQLFQDDGLTHTNCFAEGQQLKCDCGGRLIRQLDLDYSVGTYVVLVASPIGSARRAAGRL